MNVPFVNQQQLSKNLSNIFRTSGYYIQKYYPESSNEIGLTLFEEMVRDKKKRDGIWNNYATLTEQIIRSTPNIRDFIEDLVRYERALWDMTFGVDDLVTFRQWMEDQFRATQGVVGLADEDFLSLKFKLQLEPPYKLIQTHWNWQSIAGMLPGPSTPKSTFNYIVRPTVFQGAICVFSLLGMHRIIPILQKEATEFTGWEVMELVKKSDLLEYTIPLKEEQLITDVITFLREHLFLNLSIGLASVPQTTTPAKRMSVVL